MTKTSGESTPAETPVNSQVNSQPGPKLVEGPGRYRVFETPDGGLTIARATGICDTCQNCGCGDQGDPVQIPAMVIALAKSHGPGKLLGILKAGRRG